jgi:hypothetical protein
MSSRAGRARRSCCYAAHPVCYKTNTLQKANGSLGNHDQVVRARRVAHVGIRKAAVKYLASGKPRAYAFQIVEHFGFSQLFRAVGDARPTARCRKQTGCEREEQDRTMPQCSESARPHRRSDPFQTEVIRKLRPLDYAPRWSAWSWFSQLDIWFQLVKIWVTASALAVEHIARRFLSFGAQGPGWIDAAGLECRNEAGERRGAKKRN